MTHTTEIKTVNFEGTTFNNIAVKFELATWLTGIAVISAICHLNGFGEVCLTEQATEVELEEIEAQIESELNEEFDLSPSQEHQISEMQAIQQGW